jgi:phosphatidylglycerophosphatase A
MPLLQRFLTTGFGIGYVRPAPGTWGSLPPVLLALALVGLSGETAFNATRLLIIDLPLIAIAAVFSVICLMWGTRAEQHFGRKDAPSIVADEVAGQSIALLFLPWHEFGVPGALRWNLLLALFAFIAFRVTDIIKPPPARSLQRLHGGLGIVVDDLIAGVYALIVAHLAARFILRSLAA